MINNIDLKLMVICAAIIALIFLSGCAAQQREGACLALAPHFPERVDRADTARTKQSAYRRNIAFGAACDGSLD